MGGVIAGVGAACQQAAEQSRAHKERKDTLLSHKEGPPSICARRRAGENISLRLVYCSAARLSIGLGTNKFIAPARRGRIDLSCPEGYNKGYMNRQNIKEK